MYDHWTKPEGKYCECLICGKLIKNYEKEGWDHGYNHLKEKGLVNFI